MKKLFLVILMFVSCAAAPATTLKYSFDCDGAKDVLLVGTSLQRLGKELHSHMKTMIGHWMADRLIRVGNDLQAKVIMFDMNNSCGDA